MVIGKIATVILALAYLSALAVLSDISFISFSAAAVQLLAYFIFGGAIYDIGRSLLKRCFCLCTAGGIGDLLIGLALIFSWSSTFIWILALFRTVQLTWYAITPNRC